MNEQKRNWLWLDWTVFGIRTVNTLLFIVYFFSMQEQFNIPYFGVVLWIAAAYAIPLLFWLPGFSKGSVCGYSYLYKGHTYDCRIFARGPLAIVKLSR